MRGKYINTNIMMAALAGKRWRRINGQQAVIENNAKAPAVSLADHKIIWRKPATAAAQKPLYRCITACIY